MFFISANRAHRVWPASICLILAATGPETRGADAGESLEAINARLGKESAAAYAASPYSAFSKDYFARLTRDPSAKAGPGEIEIDDTWCIVLPAGCDPITAAMQTHLDDFFRRRMDVKPQTRRLPAKQLGIGGESCITLHESGGGVPDVPESFTIEVAEKHVSVQGRDVRGLRDGIVRLVDMMGMRQGPILPLGKQVNRPRLAVRLGAVPWLGSYRELVFMGYNAVSVPAGSLFALSTSDAIAELKDRRRPEALAQLVDAARKARTLGLKTYGWIDTRQKFAKDHPVFQAHPEIRGTLTWKADGDYILCPEHPLVKRYLRESVQGLFRDAPLDGLVIIIGGEGFYHCYMRSFGAVKGHSACPRCDALGAEQAVADLCNTLAEAARQVNPEAEIIAWPYSAEYVWSADRDQAGLIRLLKPGTGILTEVEKDEYVDKPEGFKKHLWDYSIDLIGPGERAKRQIAACRQAGIPIYIKSEAELAFEAPRLPSIPCMDRWLARADAIAASGATGAWMFPAFKPCYGSSVAEVFKFAWWEPVSPPDTVLRQYAERIAGRQAGANLRRAWKLVSEAIPLCPQLPSYYTGPYYLGPSHPMCADPSAKLPQVFYGRYLFMGEMTDAEGLMLRPTFSTSPAGVVPVFGGLYRRMADVLHKAVQEVSIGEPLVPDRLRLLYAAETSPIRWFYHTERAQANFYESCQLRDRLLALAAQPTRTPAEQAEAAKLYARWRDVLADERQNAVEALPVVQADMRLDHYYGGDHTFPHAADMLRAKLTIIEGELNEYLPAVAARCGIPAGAAATTSRPADTRRTPSH